MTLSLFSLLEHQISQFHIRNSACLLLCYHVTNVQHARAFMLPLGAYLIRNHTSARFSYITAYSCIPWCVKRLSNSTALFDYLRVVVILFAIFPSIGGHFRLECCTICQVRNKGLKLCLQYASLLHSCRKLTESAKEVYDFSNASPYVVCKNDTVDDVNICSLRIAENYYICKN